MFIEFW